MSTKRGRPPLPPDQRRDARVVIHAEGALEQDIRLYAEYHGKTVQDITHEWWAWLVKRNPELKVPQKRQDALSTPR